MAQWATPLGSMPPQSVYPGVLRTTRLLSGDRFAVMRQQTTVQVESFLETNYAQPHSRAGLAYP